jgi:NAD(P)H dehydrogenase (quinone)
LNILILLAHPDPKSFNAAIAFKVKETLQQSGHTVVFHDLYAEGFDPLLPAGEFPKQADLSPEIEAHCQELCQAGGIIVVHPNWWGKPPAVLSGYVDRVFRPGRAYEFLEGDSGEGVPRGLLRAKAAVVFNTTNTFPERETRVFGDPLQRIWVDCVFGLCGVEEVHRRNFGVIVTSSPEQRAAWLGEATELALEVFSE